MRHMVKMLLVGCSLTVGVAGSVLAEQGSTVDQEALAKAMHGAWLPLESGMTLSRSEGTPISAKYEIDDGAFQLSVYTTRGDRISEVIVDYSVGTVAKVDPLTDSADLTAARGQIEAMARATRTLEAVTAEAVKANPGYRAVSAMPRMRDGRPIAEIMLVDGLNWLVVQEHLD